MKKYIYTDKIKNEIVIEIIENDILEADKVFKKILGYDVTKKPFIGCQVKEIN